MGFEPLCNNHCYIIIRRTDLYAMACAVYLFYGFPYIIIHLDVTFNKSVPQPTPNLHAWTQIISKPRNMQWFSLFHQPVVQWNLLYMMTSRHVNSFHVTGLLLLFFMLWPLPNARVLLHDDVIKWKHFPRYWPFVRGIHRSPVNSTHKGQWRGALIIIIVYLPKNYTWHSYHWHNNTHQMH